MKNNLTASLSNPLLLGGLLAAVFLTGCESSLDKIQDDPTTAQSQSDAQGESGRNYVANELLIKFKDDVSEEAKTNALARISGKVSEKILTKAMEKAGRKEGLMVLHTPLQALEAVSKMKNSPEIEYAEPNYIYQHTATSTDPYYTNGSLWGMYAAGTTPANLYGSQANKAWVAGHTGSNSVVVGIIDEGIQLTHPDLNAQIWRNPGETDGDGIDNDKNGYVDDINGWDFDGNNKTIYDGGTAGTLDDHGTHVAGTIGAEANGTGVVGVNWNVTMISCKFLGRKGGTTANAVKALDYLTALKTKGINIVAINNSWGGGGFSQALFDAIARANTAGILFIAAAGNGGNDGVGDDNDKVASYPSNYKVANVIAVAAITNTGARSSFSNYGATTVHLGAPGSAIWSTTAFNGYSSYSGTSMATPHVTGGAALYASTHGGATAAQIKAAILNSATPTASLAGKCVTGGRLNVSGF